MSNESACPTVSAEDLAARVAARDDIYVVDLREPRDFHAGHIPDALLLPAGQFADRYARELDPGDAVILVCEKGMTSEAAVRFLRAQGFTNVASLAGGMAAYTGPLDSGD
jgi:Rhodanese-related sulfurtransferase